MREPNPEKLNALVGKLVNDLGISLGGASILLGDRLGLYKAMADGDIFTPSELAKKTGLHERYVREWLSGQAASGYIDYHPEKTRSRSRPNKRWRSPRRGRQLSSPVHSMSCSPPISTNPRSPKHFEQGRALAGMSIRSAFSRAPNGSSGLAITPIWFRTGFRRSKASKPN